MLPVVMMDPKFQLARSLGNRLFIFVSRVDFLLYVLSSLANVRIIDGPELTWGCISVLKATSETEQE